MSGSSIVVVTGWALITINWNRDPYWSILRKLHSERLTAETTSMTGAKCATSFGGQRTNEKSGKPGATEHDYSAPLRRNVRLLGAYFTAPLLELHCSICPLACERTAHVAHAFVVESTPSRTESGRHAEGESCGTTHAKGGQVMFCPQPLLELPLPSVPRPAAVGKCLQHPPRKCLNEAWRVRNGVGQAS